MSDLEFWKDLGNIFDAVLNYQKKNVEFNNRFINPWIRLGNVFEREDRNQEAVAAYQRATEIDPDNANNWAGLGDAQFKAGAYDEAEASYQRAVTLDPEAGWPLGNLALTLVTQGKVEEAIPLYLNSINLLMEPKDKAICWNRLGHAYRKVNDYENAFNAFKQADQLDGENAGFDDKLDEAPEEAPVPAAPAEILEQVLVAPEVEEPAPDESEITQPETVEAEALAPNMEMNDEALAAMTEETPAAEAESVPMVETEAAPVAELESAPETEAVVEPAAVEEEEESPLALHEKIDSLQVIKDIIAKVEATMSDPEPVAEVEAVAETEPVVEVESAPEVETVAETEPVVEVESAPEVEAVAITEPIAEVEPAPEVEAVAETEAVAEIESAPEVEAVAEAEPVAEVETAPEVEAVVEDEPVTEPVGDIHKLPAWLAIKHKIFGKKEPVEAAPEESVTTLSDLPHNVAVNESTLAMNMVETFADPLAIHLTEESPAAAESLDAPEESALDIEEAEEPVYQEYLKDEDEILPDHVDQIQSEAPLAQISENGEVRIAMDTNNAHVWNELGNVYLNAGSYDEAIAAYRKAIELDRRFAWPYSNLALAYVHKGSFVEAILLYQRGIELFTADKDKAITWNRLGSVYRRMNDYDNAIEAYKVADELDPDNATLSLRASFGLLGNAYSEQKPAYAA